MKLETLEFPPLNCTHDERLGDYYQDFSAAIEVIESGYHGSIDERGVPLVNIQGQGQFAIPVTCAQYGLANMIAFGRGDERRGELARVQLDWLVDAQEREGAWAGCWLMHHDDQKYPWLRAPWTGALTSGNAISALLRGWELFGVDTYRDAAEAGYRGLHAPRSSDQLFLERNGTLWYEEYPADEPLHVLNGHIYTLLGVLDYARVANDPEAEERWRRGASTTLKHLEDFDVGYWSVYDLRKREPASVHYHKNIHIPQLRILGRLTGESRFDAVANRWERYLRSRVSHARRFVAPRLHRFRRG
jgi:heparosan-N-sulfate-glucuronate 5-epimerase